MRDQEIYKELGQLLYVTCPVSESDINICARVGQGSVSTAYWYGSYTPDSSYFVRGDESRVIIDLVSELHEFYKIHGLGEWNIIHFKVIIAESRFATSFELNESLENGSLSFWKYCEKFKAS